MSKPSPLLSLFIGTLTEGGKLLFLDLLQNIADNNDEDPGIYEDAVKAGDAFANILARAAKLTKTNIDDRIVRMIKESVVESADANDVKLP